ncbi:hypothetical protein [Altericroceibacterium xinjiangense]|uniref:hypothetical protein n=1 Tax=Altericroceibacterium xinjiangense TaxID=762261 RepID=UPI000F7E0D8F|nr:hypothetical protein [Altericroceibacterium xinjiangense]
MNWSRPAALTLILALGACATPPDKYPSLAIRDAERVSGNLPPPEPYVPPAPPAEVLDRLDTLVATASEAHRAFLSAVPETRRAVTAARGDAMGSEDWAVAQIALGVLESARARTMVPLTDLDRIYAEAAVEGLALDRIAAARAEVSELVEEENRTISSLLERLS